jgi:hypothetical protein
MWFAIPRGTLKASTTYDRRQLHCVPLLPLKFGPGLRTAFATPMPSVWTALLCWALTCICAVQVLLAKANWPLLACQCCMVRRCTHHIISMLIAKRLYNRGQAEELLLWARHDECWVCLGFGRYVSMREKDKRDGNLTTFIPVHLSTFLSQFRLAFSPVFCPC